MKRYLLMLLCCSAIAGTDDPLMWIEWEKHGDTVTITRWQREPRPADYQFTYHYHWGTIEQLFGMPAFDPPVPIIEYNPVHDWPKAWPAMFTQTTVTVESLQAGPYWTECYFETIILKPIEP